MPTPPSAETPPTAVAAARRSFRSPPATSAAAVAALLLARLVPPLRAQEPDWSPFWDAWLTEVDVLLEPSEREAFRELEDDRQRVAFADAFWRARDPFPRTPRNELRDRWDFRVRQTLLFFSSLSSDLAKVALLQGLFDSEEVRCGDTRLRLLSWELASQTWTAPLVVAADGGARLAGRRELLDLFTSGDCTAPAAMRGASLGVPPLALAKAESPFTGADAGWVAAFSVDRGTGVDRPREVRRVVPEISFPEAFAAGAITEIAFRLPSEVGPVGPGSLAVLTLRGVVLDDAAGSDAVRLRHRFYVPGVEGDGSR
ncbi:MAG: GWxTD domain-containing protein, partial [Thermoanaerobaculia bacterium]|nr:GWxTD domain-containing protein [Thermoanaerobaculia bacterium]